ncbi:MAG TPA: hypothetical protein VGQ93_14970, partial [Lysobacter sp.]|nr:hypothetical protein [Lysobacter sp.]
MKQLVVLALLGCSLLLSCTDALPAAVAQAPELPVCTPQQLLGHAPDQAEVEAHRQSPLPVISYPYGTERQEWGMQATVRVDESGRVVCYGPLGQYDRNLALNEERRNALGALRYTPFQRNGRPVAAIVVERIAEQELPQRIVPLPQVPLQDV